MKGQLRDLMRGVDGEWVVSFSTTQDPRELFDELRNGDVNVEIKKFSKHRSLDANAMAWSIIDQIAGKMHKSRSETYRDILRDVPGISETVCVRSEEAPKMIRWWEHKGLGWQAEPGPSKLEGCTNITFFAGSSVFDTAQMSRLIDLLIQEAEQLGIPTITPKEEEELLRKWGRKHGETKSAEPATA